MDILLVFSSDVCSRRARRCRASERALAAGPLLPWSPQLCADVSGQLPSETTSTDGSVRPESPTRKLNIERSVGGFPRTGESHEALCRVNKQPRRVARAGCYGRPAAFPFAEGLAAPMPTACSEVLLLHWSRVLDVLVPPSALFFYSH